MKGKLHQECYDGNCWKGEPMFLGQGIFLRKVFLNSKWGRELKYMLFAFPQLIYTIAMEISQSLHYFPIMK